MATKTTYTTTQKRPQGSIANSNRPASNASVAAQNATVKAQAAVQAAVRKASQQSAAQPSTQASATVQAPAQTVPDAQAAIPNTQKPVQNVDYDNKAYSTTYLDGNGQAQQGYIINGTTYKDQAGTTPVDVGSIVNAGGQTWIKTGNGSMLYSDYLAQQKAEEDAKAEAEREAANAALNQQMQELLGAYQTASGQIRDQLAATETQLPTSSAELSANMNDLLEQWKAAAESQSTLQTDYATQLGILELERALEDAQALYKTQQNQIAADEAAALDNAALYARMRGDNGGIGQAQYNAVANTAASNRQLVASEQSKLATDTARQIADLRAQGEFEKADKLLTISQNYLSQLMSLEQWAAEYGLNEAQFKEAIRQWELDFANALNQQDLTVGQWILQMQNQLNQQDQSYQQWLAEFQNSLKQQEINNALNIAGVTGTYNGQLTLAGKNQLADMAAALLEAGITLTEDQMSSLGMTKEQVDAWALMQQLAAANTGTGGGGDSYSTVYEKLWNNGLVTEEELAAGLKEEGYDPEKYLDYAMSWQKNNLGQDATTLNNFINSGSMNGEALDNVMANWLNAGRITDSEYKYLLTKALQG